MDFSKTVWIAYSGGLDSHVLLHLYAQLKNTREINLKAIHINHGLSPNANDWARHCEKVCNQLGIPFIQKKINPATLLVESLEDQARKQRYQIFAELLQPGDYLLTAHQQDDQAETLLLQMLRGAGPKGLASMPRIKPLGLGFHVRPLLDFSRDDLISYAENHQLLWIDDESNLNVNFTRNFLRHEVLPILKKRWPTVTKTLSRVAENCQEAQQILETIADDDLMLVKGSFENTLSIQKLLELDEIRQRQVIRVWLEQLNFSLPSAVKMQNIQQNILHAKSDKVPIVKFGNVELRRFHDELYALSPIEIIDRDQVITWDFQQPLVLQNNFEMHAKKVIGQGLRADIQQVTVRFRQGGEICRLPGRKHHHELKKLFQQWGVPSWERDRIPLIFLDDELIAVVGYFLDERYAAGAEDEGYAISF